MASLKLIPVPSLQRVRCNDNDVITVRLGEYAVASNPHFLSTLSLGSCLAIIFYCQRKKIGGLAHAMLPEPSGQVHDPSPGKYVTTAISALFEEFRKRGVLKSEIEVALIGGANLLSSVSKLAIGSRNVKTARRILSSLGFRIVCSDVEGAHGRSVLLDTTTGSLYIAKTGGKSL